MYKKILIANRGEVAVRIIRACREMGIATVAVHSTVDEDSLHVKLADESVCIGKAQASESYLKIPSIIAAAEISGAQAIHPGYGFLSERYDFVEKCISSNVEFIGPTAENIRAMGDKIEAKKIADQVGIPMCPGSKGAITQLEEAYDISEKIGFPVLIKASAGGGGKGMRVVHSKANLNKAFEIARSEAKLAFGNEQVFIEKFITQPRHIEIQIAADKYGNIIHLGERDCSIQRQQQKLIEESPAPHYSSKIRQTMCDCAIKLAQYINYQSLGTIEFLVDEDENFYFMEMNTRLQVEHPVTEFVTNIDLVKLQILLACGEKLPYQQQDINFSGHAIECRINAENPDNFLPSPGNIAGYHAPSGPGVRVDSFLYQNCNVQPYYDSLAAKLIVKGKDRDEAIKKMLAALDEFYIDGIQTTIPLHIRMLQSLRYQKAELNTNFISHFFT